MAHLHISLSALGEHVVSCLWWYQIALATTVLYRTGLANCSTDLGEIISVSLSLSLAPLRNLFVTVYGVVGRYP